MKTNPPNVSKKPGFRFYAAITIASLAFGLLSTLELERESFDPDWFHITATILILAAIFLALELLLWHLVPWRWLKINTLLAAIFLRRQFTWHRFKQCILGIVFLLLLVTLFYLEENWRGKRAWETYRHQLEAAGEHLDFAYFIPPPVPDDQNFAMAPIWSIRYQRSLDSSKTNLIDPLKMTIQRSGVLIPKPSTNLSNGYSESLENHYLFSHVFLKRSTNTIFKYKYPLLGNWQAAKLTNIKSWQFYFRLPQVTNEPDKPPTNEFPISAQPQTPAADVLLALSKYAPALEALRVASQRPYSRFPLNYNANDPDATPYWHLQPIQDCSYVLALRAVTELNARQTNEAMADVKLMLHLDDALHNDYLPVFMSIHQTVFPLTIQVIWEGLAQHLWSDDQLKVLDQELSRHDALKEYREEVRATLARHLKEIEYLRSERMKNSVNCDCTGDPEEDELRIKTWLYRITPDGWFYWNEQGLAQVCISELPTDDEIKQHIISPAMQKRFFAASWQVTGGPDDTCKNKWVRMFFPDEAHYLPQIARVQASVDMARIACALERFRQAHAEYPDTLEMLAPEFMSQIPHDIINGQPLHYHRTADGQFILYSVGWNNKDDGGVPDKAPDSSYSDYETHSGDWVWRYSTN